jgi:hypothetical protein
MVIMIYRNAEMVISVNTEKRYFLDSLRSTESDKVSIDSDLYRRNRLV